MARAHYLLCTAHSTRYLDTWLTASTAGAAAGPQASPHPFWYGYKVTWTPPWSERRGIFQRCLGPGTNINCLCGYICPIYLPFHTSKLSTSAVISCSTTIHSDCPPIRPWLVSSTLKLSGPTLPQSIKTCGESGNLPLPAPASPASNHVRLLQGLRSRLSSGCRSASP